MKIKISYIISENLDSALIKTQVLNLIKELHKQNIQVTLYHRGKTSNQNGFINYKNIFKLILLLLRERKNINCIHFRGYYPLIFTGFILYWLKFKIVWDPRGVQPEEYLYQNKNIKGVLGYILFKIGEFNCLNSSKVIVSVSNNMAKYFGQKKISGKQPLSIVIPTLSSGNCIRLSKVISRQAIGMSNEDVIFCFSGSLSKWQRFEETCSILSETFKIIEKSKFLVLTKDILRAKSILNRHFKISQYTLLSVKSNEVINYLKLGNYGLLYRENILLNQVSSPVKLNDYVVAGLYTFSSSCIGDVISLYNQYKIGQTFSNKKEAIDQIIFAATNKIKINNDDKELFINDFNNLSLIAEKYKSIYEEI